MNSLLSFFLHTTWFESHAVVNSPGLLHFDLVRLLMLLICKLISTIDISVVQKSRAIPSSFFVLHSRIRPYTSWIIILPYSTPSSVTRYSLLFKYTKNFWVTFPISYNKEVPIQCMSRSWHLPTVRELHGWYLSWIMRSPSDPLRLMGSIKSQGDLWNTNKALYWRN